MSKLGDLLARQIAVNGPISLADYMADCLLHPAHGYYTTKAPFGAKGDFITAPEISQMFGELLGLCLAQAWLDQGAPARFSLVELGPGRGTLMADVLHATRGVPGFHAAAEIRLIEASPALRAQQQETLSAYPVQWMGGLDQLADQPLFLLANEFFDALPIRQFTREAEGWSETMVGLKEEKLILGRAPATMVEALTHRLNDTEIGDVVEICAPAAPIVAEISARILRRGGLALVVDYGGWRSRGDTFQALRHHAFADPLAAPGEADLTAHVDFEALAAAAQPAATAFTTQGDLLLRLGLAARAERLARGLSGAALEQHLTAAHRLTEPQEMGELFKALAIYPAAAPPPAGFALDADNA